MTLSHAVQKQERHDKALVGLLALMSDSQPSVRSDVLGVVNIDDLHAKYDIRKHIADVVQADDDYSVKFQEHYREALGKLDFSDLVGYVHPLDVVDKFDDAQIHLFLIGYAANVFAQGLRGRL